MVLKVIVIHAALLGSLASLEATAESRDRQLDAGIDEEIVVWGRAQTQNTER